MVNVILWLLMLIGTILQFTLEITEGKTLLSFFVIVLVIVSRVMFGLRLISLDINTTAIFAFEGLGIGLASVFALSSYYKNSFIMNWWVFALDIFISLLFCVAVLIESQEWVYVPMVHEEDDD